MGESPECLVFFCLGVSIIAHNVRVVRIANECYVEFEMDDDEGIFNGGGSAANYIFLCRDAQDSKDEMRRAEQIRKLSIATFRITFIEVIRKEHLIPMSRANNLGVPNK